MMNSRCLTAIIAASLVVGKLVNLLYYHSLGICNEYTRVAKIMVFARNNDYYAYIVAVHILTV